MVTKEFQNVPCLDKLATSTRHHIETAHDTSASGVEWMRYRWACNVNVTPMVDAAQFMDHINASKARQLPHLNHFKSL